MQYSMILFQRIQASSTKLNAEILGKPNDQYFLEYCSHIAVLLFWVTVLRPALLTRVFWNI